MPEFLPLPLPILRLAIVVGFMKAAICVSSVKCESGNQHTICSLPMALERLGSWFNATFPWLRKLICLKVFVMMGKKTFGVNSQMVLEEVDHVEKPSKVDVLLVFPTKHGLPSGSVICLVLRQVEVRDPTVIAEARVQGNRGQAKLDSIHERAFHACRDNAALVFELVHVIIELGIEDRIDDVDI